MISRVAEGCFWLHRHLERVETLARMLDVNLTFVLDVNLPAAERWKPLLIVTGEEEPFTARFGGDATNDAEAVQRYLTWDEACATSIYRSLHAARENARTIRETISLEMWEGINQTWLWLSGRLGRKAYDKDRHEFYLRLRNQGLLFHGIAHNTVLHEAAFDFMRLGTALERTGQTARILDVKYHALGPTGAGPETSAETAQWLATLRSCSGIEPFFKRAENVLDGPHVAAFLILDEQFPRSVRHNLDRTTNFLRRVRALTHGAVGQRSAAKLEALRAHVTSLGIDDLRQVSGSIHANLTRIILATDDVCSSVHQEFFDPPLVALPASRGDAAGAGDTARAAATPAASTPAAGDGGTPAAAASARVVTILHETIYRYDRPIQRSEHVLRLQPVSDHSQEILASSIEVSVAAQTREYEDVFGNAVRKLEITTPFTELVIRARSTVRVHAHQLRRLDGGGGRLEVPLVWMPWQRQMMMPYLMPPELPESELRVLSEYAMSFVERNDYDLTKTLLDMNLTIYRDFVYVPDATDLTTTPFELFVSRKGVCQDFANLLICLARLLSVPARYRVGYIYTGGQDENKIQSDASHAWVEIYLPWTGWHGLDPTNGCVVGHDHVRVACGRTFQDATPTAGTIYAGGGNETLAVQVRVDVDDGPPATSAAAQISAAQS